MEEAIRRLWAFVRSLNDRLITVEIQHGETDEITFQDSFPSSPYNNQMILRTDLKPPKWWAVVQVRLSDWDLAKTDIKTALTLNLRSYTI